MLTSENFKLRNIAIVLPAIAREGITKLVATQIKVLEEEGYFVRLIVLSKVNEDIFDELNIREFQDSCLILNQKDTYLSIKNLLSAYTTILPIVNFIKAHKIEIVLAHGPYAHFIIRLVKCVTCFLGVRIKLIQFFHINQYEQFPLNSFRRVIINSFNKILAVFLDDVHVSVSNAVKKDIQSHLIRHKKHLVVFNPVPLEVREANNNVEQRLQLLLGNDGNYTSSTYKLLLSNRIEPSKGQLFFIRVLERFVKTFQLYPQDIQVIVAGDGVQKEELLSIIKQKGLGRYVQYVGVLSAPDLAVVLNVVDVIVVPSMYEGFSFTTLEALEVGCLVLASDAGGLKEVIKDRETGFLFEAGNENDCYDKLNYIYSNRNKTLIKRERIAEDISTRFSVKSYKKELLNIFKLV